MRKSGFTIAPEAGTQRLRNVINKNLDEATRSSNACRLAFEAGWDLDQAVFHDRPADRDRRRRGRPRRSRARDPRRRPARREGPEAGDARSSASSFVPKSGDAVPVGRSVDRLAEPRTASRIGSLRACVEACGSSTTSARRRFSKASSPRGDRRLGGVVLERALPASALRFDGWAEHFKHDAWHARSARKASTRSRLRLRRLGDRAPAPVGRARSAASTRSGCALELKRALAEGDACRSADPTDCHGCAPFAKECVKGVVKETDRAPSRLRGSRSSPTPPAAGPGVPARADGRAAVA